MIEIDSRKAINSIKPIAIIDSFVRNESVRARLNECVSWLKSSGIEVMLVSNIKFDFPESVDHFLYDRRNQLFQGEYTGIRDIDIFRINDSFESHEIKSGMQRHGLSVLVNLFNSLNLAKSLGYTHFYRLEVDDIFGAESVKFIKSVPEICASLNKKALFYYNERYSGEPSNMSFHFIYSEIGFFLDKVRQIRCEEDYRAFLLEKRGSLDFMIAEEYVYSNLKAGGDEGAIIRDGGTMAADFPDTVWNTIVSDSNIDPRHRGVTTSIYRIREKDGIAIMSYSYAEIKTERKIKVYRDGNLIETIEHRLMNSGGWSYHIPPYEFDEIEIYDGEEFLYSEKKQNTKNYIIFR